MRCCDVKSLHNRLVAEDEQGIEAEVVAAKDTKTSAATSFDAAAGLAALTKARHRFSNYAHSTKSQDGAQGGRGIANTVRNREMKGGGR